MGAGPVAAELVEDGKIFMKFKDINSTLVEKRIEQFESQVDFELIPVLIKKSSYTEHVPWMLSLILILILTWSADFFIDSVLHSFGYYTQYDKTIYIFSMIIISVLLSRWLSHFDAVQRLFISNHEKERQVYQKAQKILSYKRLSNPQSKNALLIFVSLLEKRIEILPDPNTHFEGHKEVAQKVLKVMLPYFKNNDYEKGILAAIEATEESLKSIYPRTGSPDNLIPNKLIWWKD